MTYTDPTFSADLIAWQSRHGRHSLPWQNTRDAYRIWLSEIMLQQTQVSAVIPYYEKFLTRFPDLATLAAADQADVMAYWSGLGYYSRARNLHACAQAVMRGHGGVFPADPAKLADLPGIGRSTAAAIAAFSYGVRAAILDGNVKRVFARVFGVDVWPGEKKTEQQLWLRAEALLPVQGIEAYTQGLMDLGATLCTRSKPDCARCPFQARCVAHATGRTAELPVKKPAREIPEKYAHLLILQAEGHILLEQRPQLGIWGGLLSLPELAGHVSQDDEYDADWIAQEAAQRFGARDAACRALPPLSHQFTHFRLHIQPWLLDLAQMPQMLANQDWTWRLCSTLQDLGLPAPVKKLLTGLYEQPALWRQDGV
ncbi:A/G-specific adenine glycosylase [Massilia sp. W12]|uniref:A/G-specific adenine glycosylase n=1 Tax=Massilia sp. W12 TaxID=3126507 RepID=UPI0030CE2CAF